MGGVTGEKHVLRVVHEGDVAVRPGDPGMAHKRDEFCRVAEIGRVTDFLRGYLTSRVGE